MNTTADDLRPGPADADTVAKAHAAFSHVYQMRVDMATEVLKRMNPYAVRDVVLACDVLRSTALSLLPPEVTP